LCIDSGSCESTPQKGLLRLVLGLALVLPTKYFVQGTAVSGHIAHTQRIDRDAVSSRAALGDGRWILIRL
jgi:hypothetical protein